ncbi:hypothetical protein JD844_023043 [Phrynosoma platyrhinos]|uniref:HMG box domain-containing protein n=1 Tax=Phrynosoma platyrhinos TaxID=52577 RepID=A0ABQ7SVW3_PHRPL|nr:hypothetical protein JD844_023043 [Phrynosoma platyrhinos]
MLYLLLVPYPQTLFFCVRYEEKAARDLDRYKKQSRKAMDQNMKKSTTGKEKMHKPRLKDCLSNHPKLDKLFHSQMEKKHNSCQTIKIVQVPFSMDSFKQKLHMLEQNESDKDEPCLIHLLNFPDAWIIASEKKIMMLNPYRIEEALLFKRLLENHKLPIEKLDKPIVLTDRVFAAVLLGGFLPKPDSDVCLTSHPSSEKSFIFVNNRPVYQKEILKLVQQYYKLKLHMDSNRLYPIFLINITIPPSAVDINLTPDKSQVLLHNQESICLAVENILTSLYGPVTGAISCETNKTDINLEDNSINETGQTTIYASEIESCRSMNQEACMPLLSSNNNGEHSEREKYTELNLNKQTLCNNLSQDFPTKIDTSGSITPGYDRFQDATLNNLLCEDQHNKSKGIFSLDSSTLMDTNLENGIENDLKNDNFLETEKRKGVIIPKDSSEFTADQWSLGNAFKNSRGENLEPIQILIPEGRGVQPQKKNDENQQKLQEENNSQTINKTNVVNDKVGQITAYDIISSQIIKKPMTAFAYFTQDHRPGLLTENTKASTEELMLKMDEMWKILNEEEKKK